MIGFTTINSCSKLDKVVAPTYEIGLGVGASASINTISAIVQSTKPLLPPPPYSFCTGSMAVRGYSSAQIMVQESCRIRRPAGRVVAMLKHRGQVSVRKIPALEITPSFRNKVFEDQSKGIVCYRDDKGEIVCEGFDEGPRLHHELQRENYHQRDAEIIDLLRMVTGGEGIATRVPEDFN